MNDCNHQTTHDNAAPLLEMRGVVKRFGGQVALGGVNFRLLAGETHILAGENGAGKSTLMKILAGVQAADAGEILLDGVRQQIATPGDARALGIAIIHQELSLIPTLSVMDNIFLGRERCLAMGWLDRRAQQEICRQLFGRLRLDVDPARWAGSYPIAVQQQVEVAKALAFGARILVMDEPTSALAMPEVRNLFEIIAGLKREGCGIVYISHKMEEIYEIGDRVTVLRDGCSIATAPLAEAPRARLVSWMVGRELTQVHEPQRVAQGAVRLKIESLTVPDPAGVRGAAIEKLGLEIRAGEVVGLGGLQGSGASELLHGLFGTYGALSDARVEIDGQAYRPKSPRHAIAAGVALLTSDRKTTGLVLGQSVLQNLTLAALPRFSRGGWLRLGAERDAARAACAALRIKCAGIHAPVVSLSGGNQQKVALAKWLETGPRVLLLDEPTRGVDIGAKHEIYALMDQWRAAGYAILLITTEMAELLALSDRIVVLHRGRIAAQFSAEAATQERVLAAAMGQEEDAA